MSDQIKVGLKVRPLIPREIADKLKCNWIKNSENSVVQVDPITRLPKGEAYVYDNVFGPESSNQEVFEVLVKPIVESAVRGFNGTIFAYGQTSSGKTYTMMGDQFEPGIIPLAVNYIFDAIENTRGREFLLRVSYMEIYNERVNDLLQKDNENLKVIEDNAGNVIVKDLKETITNSPVMVMDVMKKGEQVRKIGETGMNERSSRSHSIFRLIIESREVGGDTDGAVQVSQLNLVDLAGSERAGATGAVGERFKEGCAINKSLFMLGQVIAKLSEGETFVNFRNSKLTRILQSSLGGNALTAIVCAVTPTAIDETTGTLGFASRARNIKTTARVNEVLSDEALLKRYAKQIKKLNSEIDRLRGGHVDEQLQLQLEEKNQQNQELMERLNRLRDFLLVSSTSSEPDVLSQQKLRQLRRRTWSAPMKSRERLSLAPVGHKIRSLSDIREDPRLSITSLKSDDSDKMNDSVFTPMEEFEMDLIKAEKDKSMDVDLWIPFSDDVKPPTSEGLAPPNPPSFVSARKPSKTRIEVVRAEDQNTIMTPPSKLRMKVKYLEQENDDLREWTRLEKQMFDEQQQEEIFNLKCQLMESQEELEEARSKCSSLDTIKEELAHLRSSDPTAYDLQMLLLDANKNAASLADTNKQLSLELEDARKKCCKMEELQSALTSAENRITLLNKEKADLQQQMNAKRVSAKPCISYDDRVLPALRSSLEDPMEDTVAALKSKIDMLSEENGQLDTQLHLSLTKSTEYVTRCEKLQEKVSDLQHQLECYRRPPRRPNYFAALNHSTLASVEEEPTIDDLLQRVLKLEEENLKLKERSISLESTLSEKAILQDDVEKEDKTSLGREIDSLVTRLQESQQEVEVMQNSIDQKNKMVASLETALQDAGSKVDEKEEQLRQMNISREHLEERIDSLMNQLGSLKEEHIKEINSLQQQKSELEEAAYHASAEIKGLKEENAKLNALYCSSKEDLEKLLKEVPSKPAGGKELEVILEGLTEDIKQFKSSLEIKETLAEKVKALMDDNCNLSGIMERMLEELKSIQNCAKDTEPLKQEMAALEEENKSLKKSLETAYEKLALAISSAAETDELCKKLIDLKKENERVSSSLENINKEITLINEQMANREKLACHIALVQQDKTDLGIVLQCNKPELEHVRNSISGEACMDSAGRLSCLIKLLEEEKLQLTGDLEAAKLELRLSTEKEKLSSVVHSLQTEVEQKRIALSELEGEKSVLMNEVTKLEEERSHLADKLHTMREDIVKVTCEIKSLESEKTDLQPMLVTNTTERESLELLVLNSKSEGSLQINSNDHHDQLPVDESCMIDSSDMIMSRMSSSSFMVDSSHLNLSGMSSIAMVDNTDTNMTRANGTENIGSRILNEKLEELQKENDDLKVYQNIITEELDQLKLSSDKLLKELTSLQEENGLLSSQLSSFDRDKEELRSVRADIEDMTDVIETRTREVAKLQSLLELSQKEVTELLATLNQRDNYTTSIVRVKCEIANAESAVRPESPARMLPKEEVPEATEHRTDIDRLSAIISQLEEEKKELEALLQDKIQEVSDLKRQYVSKTDELLADVEDLRKHICVLQEKSSQEFPSKIDKNSLNLSRKIGNEDVIISENLCIESLSESNPAESRHQETIDIEEKLQRVQKELSNLSEANSKLTTELEEREREILQLKSLYKTDMELQDRYIELQEEVKAAEKILAREICSIKKKDEVNSSNILKLVPELLSAVMEAQVQLVSMLQNEMEAKCAALNEELKVSQHKELKNQEWLVEVDAEMEQLRHENDQLRSRVENAEQLEGDIMNSKKMCNDFVQNIRALLDQPDATPQNIIVLLEEKLNDLLEKEKEIEELQKNLENYEKQVASFTADLNNLKYQLSDQNDVIQDLEEQLVQCGKAAEGLGKQTPRVELVSRTTKWKARQEALRVEDKVVDLKEELDNLSESTRSLKTERRSLQLQLFESRHKLDSAQAEITKVDDLQNELWQREADIENLKSELQHVSTDNALIELRHELSRKEDKVTNLEEQLQIMNSNFSVQALDLQQFTVCSERKDEELKALKEQLQEAKALCQNEVDTLRTEMNKQLTEVADLSSEHQDTSAKLSFSHEQETEKRVEEDTREHAEDLQETLADQKKKQYSTDKELDSLRLELAAKDEVFKQLQKDLETQITMVDDLKKKLMEQESTSQELQSQLEMKDNCIKDLKNELTTTEAAAKEVETVLEESKKYIIHEEVAVRDMQCNLADRERRIQNLEQHQGPSVIDLEAEIQELKMQLVKKEAQTLELLQCTESSERKDKELEDIKEQLQKTKALQQSEVETLRSEIAKKGTEIADLHSELEFISKQLVSESFALEQQTEISEKRAEELKEELAPSRQSMSELEANLEVTQQRLHDTEGALQSLILEVAVKDDVAKQLQKDLEIQINMVDDLKKKLVEQESASQELCSQLEMKDKFMKELTNELATAEAAAKEVETTLEKSKNAISLLEQRINDEEVLVRDLRNELVDRERLIQNLEQHQGPSVIDLEAEICELKTQLVKKEAQAESSERKDKELEDIKERLQKAKAVQQSEVEVLQSEIAKKGAEIRDLRNELECVSNQLVAKSFALEQQTESLEKRVKEVKEELASSHQIIGELEEKVEVMQQRHHDTEGALQSLKLELVDKDDVAKQLQKDLEIQINMVDDLKKKLVEQESTSQELQSQLEMKDNFIKALKNELTTTEAAAKKVETTLEESKNAIGLLEKRIHDGEIIVKNLRNELAERERTILKFEESQKIDPEEQSAKEMKAEIRALRSQLVNAEAHSKNYRDKAASFLNEVTAQKELVSQLRAEFTQTEKLKASLEEELTAVKNSLEVEKKDVEILKKELQKVKRDVEKERSEKQYALQLLEKQMKVTPDDKIKELQIEVQFYKDQFDETVKGSKQSRQNQKRLLNEVAELKLQLKEARASQASSVSSAVAYKEKLIQLEKQLSDHQETIKRLETDLMESNKLKAELEEDRDLSHVEVDRNDHKSVRTNKTVTWKLRRQADRQEGKLEDLREEIEKLHTTINTVKSESQDVKKELLESQQKLGIVQAEVASGNSTIATLQGMLKMKEEEVSALKAELACLEKRLAECSSCALTKMVLPDDFQKQLAERDSKIAMLEQKVAELDRECEELVAWGRNEENAKIDSNEKLITEKTAHAITKAKHVCSIAERVLLLVTICKQLLPMIDSEKSETLEMQTTSKEKAVRNTLVRVTTISEKISSITNPWGELQALTEELQTEGNSLDGLEKETFPLWDSSLSSLKDTFEHIRTARSRATQESKLDKEVMDLKGKISVLQNELDIEKSKVSQLSMKSPLSANLLASASSQAAQTLNQLISENNELKAQLNNLRQKNTAEGGGTRAEECRCEALLKQVKELRMNVADALAKKTQLEMQLQVKNLPAQRLIEDLKKQLTNVKEINVELKADNRRLMKSCQETTFRECTVCQMRLRNQRHSETQTVSLQTQELSNQYWLSGAPSGIVEQANLSTMRDTIRRLEEEKSMYKKVCRLRNEELDKLKKQLHQVTKDQENTEANHQDFQRHIARSTKH